MRLRQIVPPDEPWTTAEAAYHLRAVPEDEELIVGFLAAATSRVELEAGRAFGAQTWEAVLSEFPAGNICLGFGPVTAITSIVYKDADGIEQTLDASLYEIEDASSAAEIIPLADWPTTAEGANTIVVRFEAGDGWPADAKQAVLMLAAHWYSTREAVSDGAVVEVPYAVTSLIGLRRRMHV